MRRRSLRRSSHGRRRIPEWRFAKGSTDGVPFNFLTDKMISHWALWPVGTFDTSGEATPPDTGPFVPNPTDLTLIRSLHYWNAWVQDPVSTSSTPTDAMVTLAMGLIKWSHPNPELINGGVFNAGDEIPGPITNPTMDWIWRIPVSARSFGSVSQTLTGGVDILTQQSRAMRKLSQNEGLLQVFEFKIWETAVGFSANRDISWYFESRMLLKEA